MNTIITISEAKKFCENDSEQTLAEKKTLEHVVERVAKALALVNDGVASDITCNEWRNEKDVYFEVTPAGQYDTDCDGVLMKTPGGPKDKVWVGLTNGDHDHGNAFALVVLIMLQFSDISEDGILAYLNLIEKSPKVPESNELNHEFALRCEEEDRIIARARGLVRQWKDVAGYADGIDSATIDSLEGVR